ncbi:MAG: hypothetical protein Q9201_006472 [Fulgogasparrea decipioides]
MHKSDDTTGTQKVKLLESTAAKEKTAILQEASSDHSLPSSSGACNTSSHTSPESNVSLEEYSSVQQQTDSGPSGSSSLLPTSPTEFKKMILDHIHSECRITYILCYHELDMMPMMTIDCQVYRLWAEVSLDHGDFDANLHRGLRHVKSDSSNLTMTTADEADKFIPLGYLVEPDDNDETGRLTNYVFALNVSTEPMSLWLIYDHVRTFAVGGTGLVGLGSRYTNLSNESSGRRYTYEGEFEESSKGYLGIAQPWDIIKVFDIDDWQPDNDRPPEPSFGKSYELGSMLRAYALHGDNQEETRLLGAVPNGISIPERHSDSAK